MIEISLCMIVKNEEKMLGSCLESVKDLVDEIVIIDTGSDDKTKEIAKQFTDLVYDFEWVNDFSVARNFAFSKGTKEYLMWLDADDVLLDDDRKEFLKLKQTLNPEVDVVIMNYNLGVDEKGLPKVKFKRERLIKRGKNYKWVEPVHEYVDFNYSDNIQHSEIGIAHGQRDNRISDRNLKILENVLQKNGTLNSRQLFYLGRELAINHRYDGAIEAFNEYFQKEKNGSVSFYLTAFQDLYHCYMSLNDPDMAIRSLIRSFEYMAPRAEIICKIAYFYKEQGEISKAISWFTIALNLPKTNETLGYVSEDLWGFIPAIELTTLYLTQGKYNEALYYLKKSSQFKPYHPINRKILMYIKYKTGQLEADIATG